MLVGLLARSAESSHHTCPCETSFYLLNRINLPATVPVRQAHTNMGPFGTSRYLIFISADVSFLSSGFRRFGHVPHARGLGVPSSQSRSAPAQNFPATPISTSA